MRAVPHRRRSPAPLGDEVDRVLDSLFGAAGSDPADLQRLAVRRALAPGVSIIAGGPGTGKTYTVARLLAAAHLVAAEQGRPLSVALAAPTGKAAARMGEAVQAAVGEIDLGEAAGDVAGLVAATAPTTIHSLLGWADRTHFHHDRDHPLPEDMVIIDETSMVSLPLMAKLLAAVRPEASVVLVGDPFQLASIEAGTVMSDVVGPRAGPMGRSDPRAPCRTRCPGHRGGHSHPVGLGGRSGPRAGPGRSLADRVTVLRAMRRFEGDSTIAALADAVRTGDRIRALALLEEGADDLQWLRPDDAPGPGRCDRPTGDAGRGADDGGVGRRRSRRHRRRRAGQGPGRHPTGSEQRGRLDRPDRERRGGPGGRGSTPNDAGMSAVRSW